MRGTLEDKNRTELKARITPAHAGNTAMDDGIREDLQDHPRTCGEH